MVKAWSAGGRSVAVWPHREVRVLTGSTKDATVMGQVLEVPPRGS
jgi:hypothetical protein